MLTVEMYSLWNRIQAELYFRDTEKKFMGDHSKTGRFSKLGDADDEL